MRRKINSNDNEKLPIVDSSKCMLSLKNGMYGGNAGSKEGIVFQDENWIVKYPKDIRNLKNVDMSYSTAPISEYIGSHIYNILGYNVHQTLLGLRNSKIVVACRDFCDTKNLLEMRTIKNVYNQQLSQMLDETLSSTSDSHKIEIDEVITHLDYNPILKTLPKVKDRFWDMVVIDCFIANNDRNNGNWGLLVSKDGYELAPIFDNGSSFNNRASDEKVLKIMSNEKNFIGTEINQSTVFSKEGHLLSAKKLLNLYKDYPDLAKAIKRNYLLIKNNMNKIINMIDNIPLNYKGYEIISPIRKEYYQKSLDIRFSNLIEPLYNEILKSEQDKINDGKKQQNYNNDKEIVY